MIKTMLKNLLPFSNKQTLIVTFLIEPFFSILFFYLLSPFTQSNKLILTALVLMAITGIIAVYSQIFVYAKGIDILKDIFISAKGFIKFNLCALSIAILVSFLQTVVLVVIYKLLRFKLEFSLKDLALVLPLVILFTSIYAIICSVFSLRSNNPYFLSNLIMSLLPIISATIVPISDYPSWLAMISKLLPFWMLQNIVWKGRFSLALFIIYLLVGLVLLFAVLTVKRKEVLENE